MLLTRSFKKALLIFPLTLVLLAFATQIWEPSFLITHPKYAGYVEKTEVIVPFILVLFCFIRVITRNCYAPLFICVFFDSFFSMTSKEIQKGTCDIKLCIVDPFISTYMLSDNVPDAMAEQFTDLTALQNAWTYNRLLFFALGAVLLIGTYFLLRREKLHKGFGD